MVKPTIISEEPLTLNEMKKEIKKIRERDGELDIRSEKTEDYLNRTKMLTLKDEKEIIKELTEANIPRFRDEHIKKLVNLMPMDADEVKEILKPYSITVKKEDLEKIAKIFQKYMKV